MTQSNRNAADAREIATALADHPTAVQPFRRLVTHEMAATSEGNKRGLPVSVQRKREDVLPLASAARGEGEE